MKDRLSPCPESPNCVSSLSNDPRSKIDPLFFQQSPSDAQSAARKLVRILPRTRIAEEEPGYLHIEFKSRILGFVDDVEIVFGSAGRIDYRSASRVGHSDFGVNRRRMEGIRRHLLALPGFSNEPPA